VSGKRQVRFAQNIEENLVMQCARASNVNWVSPLMSPFPAEEMETFEVSKDVGNVKNNSSDLLDSA
jgi:putative SOS response-associated peptidase YedK